MPKSPDALRSSLAKTAAKAAANGSLLGSSVGPSQNIVVRTQTAAFESVDQFRASPLLENGTVFACDSKLWQYDTSIRNPDDGVNFLKPTAVGDGEFGRAKALYLTYSVAGTSGTVADLAALALAPAQPHVYVTGGAGQGLWACVPRDSITPDGDTMIAGLPPIGWRRIGSERTLADLERNVVESISAAAYSFWLHPDYGKTFASTACTAWNDYLTTKIGGHTAHNCTDPANPAHRPVAATFANGCPALQDNGGLTTNMPLGGAAAGSGSHTFCALIDVTSTAGYGVLISAANTGELGIEIAGNTATNSILIQNSAHTAVPGATTVTGLQTLAWVYDATAGTCDVYYNGQKVGALTGRTAINFTPSLLGYGSNSYQGKLGSVVYCNSANSALVSAFHAWAVRRAAVPDWTVIDYYDDLQADSIAAYRCAHSTRRFTSAATKAIIEWTSDTYAAFGAYSEIAMRVDETVTTIASTATSNRSSQVLAAGSKTLEFRDGIQTGTTSVNRTKINRVRLNAAATESSLAAPANRLVVVGDSISVGFVATHPTTDAWPILLRSSWSGRVTTYGRGYWALKTDGETAEGRAAIAANVAAMCDGTSTNIVWIALGYNDFYAAWDTTTFGSAYGDMLDKIHALVPSAVIYAQSPITATNDTGLPAYRTAIQSACATRAWATYVDGTTIEAAISGDGIHPTTAGFVTYAAYVLDIIT